MNFSLSDEHRLLRDSARTFLGKEVDLGPLLVPGASVAQAGYDTLWKQMVALGWPAMVIPEDLGGLGMSLLDMAMVVGECGRVLAPSPLFGTLAGTWALQMAASPAQQREWLTPVAEGSAKLALAVASADGRCDQPDCDVAVASVEAGPRLTGMRPYVVDAAAADLIVVAAGCEQRRWYVVDRHAAGLVVEMMDWRDITRQVCTVRLKDTPAVALEGTVSDTWPAIRDRLLLVLAAESSGGLQAVLEDTTAWAKERTAFGRPIGAYQAIKHSLADMMASAECAATAVLYAAWSLAEEHADAALAVAMAQSCASEAYREATHRSIQIFGAIGFTWELKNHLYFKRARANMELLGSPASHRERVIRILEARAVRRPLSTEQLPV